MATLSSFIAHDLITTGATQILGADQAQYLAPKNSPIFSGMITASGATFNGVVNLVEKNYQAALNITGNTGSESIGINIYNPNTYGAYDNKGINIDIKQGTGLHILNLNGTGIYTSSSSGYALIVDGRSNYSDTATFSGGIIVTGATFNEPVVMNIGSILGNIFIGKYVGENNTTGVENTAIGVSALSNNTTGVENTAIGVSALSNNTTGVENTAIGVCALSNNTAGFINTAIGVSALSNNTAGFTNTGIGQYALGNNTIYSNCTGVGFNTQCTGSNQVILGDGNADTYVKGGTVHSISDIRDKADVRDTLLGLEFINNLRPVDYKWDMRGDYRTEAPKNVNKPILPIKPNEDASDNELEIYENEITTYNEKLILYDTYVITKDKWLEDSKLDNITHDGTKKRNRYHHGVIAQEVQSLIDSTGVDFGGFQNHTINGGDDTLSIGYSEFIAPLIKAVQELTLQNKDLNDRIVALESIK